MGIKSIWKSLTSSASQAGGQSGSRQMREEPLECVSKEHTRDEHLKNLGMKRNKSIRRTIAKKLKRKKDETDYNKENLGGNESPAPRATSTREDPTSRGPTSTRHQQQRDLPQPPPSSSSSSTASRQQPPVHIETRTSIGSKIEGGTRVEVLTVVGKGEKDLVGETQPLPGHIENEIPKRMDKLRRSIRHSVRKRKESANSEMPRAQKWQLDESAVRASTCKFYVKYLGAAEVFESRGMQVCEAAVKRLKTERRRTVRGTLFVSGDSVRLVDDDTKALIIDQTIEKVSFCAPDRNFERGFSYISRDGTTRRWMCHAFMAVGDTGERLSHAVGCAFGICLEYKQKRDKANVSVQYEPKDSSFTRNGSFRVGTISERLADPQAMRIISPVPRTLGSVSEAENITPMERPRPTELMYQRQASYRGLGQISGNTPFKRHSRGHISLRLNELPSTVERRAAGLLRDSPILEDIELPASNLEDNSSKSLDLLSGEDPFTAAEMAAYSGISGSSTPAMRGVNGCDSSSTYSTSPPPTLLVPTRLHKLAETPESEMLNPWEHVPDQPVAVQHTTPFTSQSRVAAFSTPSSLSTTFSLPPSSVSTHSKIINHHNSDSLQLHLTNTTNAIQQMSITQQQSYITSPAPNHLPVTTPSTASAFTMASSDYSSTPGGYDSSLSSPPSLSDPAAWSILSASKQQSHQEVATAQHLINNIKGSISLDFPKQSSTSSGYNSPTSSQHSGSLSNTDWPTSFAAVATAEHNNPSNNFQGGGDTHHNVSNNFHTSILDEMNSNMQNSILEDPFDAEWAAIATRNYNAKEKEEMLPPQQLKVPANSKNPFISESVSIEAFQLHL